MARKIDCLNSRSVRTLGEGFHADGGGLYLRVDGTGARRWCFLYRFRGKRREMGFGPLSDISLASARQLAQDARSKVRTGADPILERARQRAAVVAIPFGELAEQIVQDLTPQWKNPKVPQQWRTTLTVDAASLTAKLVSDVTTEDVLAVLKQIWISKPVTARRLRGRIERILDAAKAKGMRSGDNPARWRGHMSLLLPSSRRVKKHHAALAYDKVRGFMQELRQSESISAVALDFTILTAARTSETLWATGMEFDLREAVWTVPGVRMKSGRPHRVPLSVPALAIAKHRIEVCGQGLLFPGLRPRSRRNDDTPRPLSNMAMAKMVKLLGYPVTVHGFRSTFRDWAGDRTAFPREIIEAAMAHIVGDEAEQAYRRSDALERRRKLMDAWAEYCEPGARVVQLIA